MKLISAESLLKKFDTGALLFESDIRKIIEEEPEAVVRCRNCEHAEVYNYLYMWCNKFDRAMAYEWFCSYGERRTDEKKIL